MLRLHFAWSLEYGPFSDRAGTVCWQRESMQGWHFDGNGIVCDFTIVLSELWSRILQLGRAVRPRANGCHYANLLFKERERAYGEPPGAFWQTLDMEQEESKGIFIWIFKLWDLDSLTTLQIVFPVINIDRWGNFHWLIRSWFQYSCWSKVHLASRF